MNARLQEMMAADTGQSVERIAHDINRDYWMSAVEARTYGVVDLIVGQTDGDSRGGSSRSRGQGHARPEDRVGQRHALKDAPRYRRRGNHVPPFQGFNVRRIA